MRLVLKDFQTHAVAELVDKLRRAVREVAQSNETQAVGLSSPTGSGKTVIVTAAMECLLQGDSDNRALSDAVFLWITDQPQLNEQTRRKMLKDSSLFNQVNLVTIGSSFDQEVFDPGTVNFINIQKLGKERDLITKGDERQYTIWETITNSVEASPDRFFVVIDEAHRGMIEGSKARSEASTIIQKFIKGSADEIPKVPLVLGISATIDRFNKLVSGTGRTMRSVDIPIDQVRASGLLKEVVTLYHPTVKQPTDITMLREAVRSWGKFRDEWDRYCQAQDESLVRPVLAVQVQDAAGKRVSRTDLDEVVSAIEDELGGISDSALAHAFQEGAQIRVNGKEVRYLAPADIDGDPDVQVVFFKTSLNTGWDCPRAEVIMSFRTALDATSIAQLVGRMVRSPLARRIDSSDYLNGVSLYLPHYDEAGLTKVIDRLTTPDPDNLPPVEFRRGENQVSVSRAPECDAVFAAIERLPSYIVPSQRKVSQVRRLMKLARALGNDEVEPDAEEVGFAALVGVLLDEYDRVQGTDAFAKLVEERSEVTIRGVDWQVGLSSVDEETTIKLEVSSENIDDVFDEAGRHIGDEGLHKEWWKVRRRESVDNTQAKLELVALSIDPAVRRRLESAAQQKVQEWLRGHKTAIDGLTERRRQTYDDIRGQAADPELRSLALPEEMTITKSDSLWERHAYLDEDGKYPATLNRWETAVVRQELDHDDTVVWFRNIPRKPWALTVPYEASGKSAAFYPDFLFARRVDGEWAVDLLDPHHIELADAPAKALGLAKYAAKHHAAFGRIELIIVRGTDDEIRRIDLVDEAKREKVLAVKTKEHLALLFEEL